MPAYLFLDLDETLIVAKARLNKLSEAASQALDLTEEFKYGQENDIFYRIHVDTHNWLFSYLAQTPTDNLVVWIFTDGTYQEVFIKYMLSQMYSVFSTIQYRINFANINTFKIAVQNSDGKYKVKRIRNKIARIEQLIYLKNIQQYLKVIY
ncbi:hypothetical protein [Pelagibaculum spongiae]|uniref:Uncharacterized protein n=1 Tax=Pelagibaculum spongiae TaxID=2080658 RepID=A0A2V1GZU0_9GAMM|nr:hypothetical protein [Pelagibaculum spongiae]PVZ68851.1 hypothetical protein DC094_11390 [Pelagibaculum spongiae]